VYRHCQPSPHTQFWANGKLQSWLYTRAACSTLSLYMTAESDGEAFTIRDNGLHNEFEHRKRAQCSTLGSQELIKTLSPSEVRESHSYCGNANCCTQRSIE